MATVIVLDACVLIAFVDRTHHFHHDARIVLSHPEQFVISALTAAEVMVYPLESDHGDWLNLFRDLGVAIVAIEEENVPGIAEMRRVSGLRMPDALVLWLAQNSGSSIATFDAQLIKRAQELGVAVAT
ncbi:MAG: PIN domain-containing protein [Propionibacteriaceae bacterium]|nr:PIN domain-containing protein [Propionibacteriaceae bacterium]